MSNYEDYGFDQYLLRPIAEANKQSFLDFDSSLDEFAWDKGHGGLLNLGGSNNNNGILFATDQQGNRKLSITNDGISLNDPKVKTYNPSASGTVNLDVTVTRIHKINMPAGNITIAVLKATIGQCFIIEILQDSVGSRTVTWFGGISWSGGSAPTLTTTANKKDTFGFRVTGNGTYDGYTVGLAV